MRDAKDDHRMHSMRDSSQGIRGRICDDRESNEEDVVVGDSDDC